MTGVQTCALPISTKGLVLKAAASQSANLLEVQDSSGNVLAYIDPSGNFSAVNVSGGSSASAGFVSTLLLGGM